MLGAERKRLIVDYVRKHNSATVNRLATTFGVHEATIRRDLSEIEQEGLLRRTHGGVVMEQWTNGEPVFSERSQQCAEEKMRIGQKAASLVQDGDHIIIDSGTTTLHIARNLVNHSRLTVVTNDINIASELRDATGVKVILTGGELYPSSYMLNGMLTDYALQSLHVVKAFIGTPALHSQHGIMHPEAQLVPAKQGMIRAAREIIVATDHRKIGRLSLHAVAPASAIHTIVTGEEADPQELESFRNNGTTIYTV
ncbi:DeoR/GlpR transcriptional regulator [Paenibacillaceae bacterium]|nr:DeoR/GlpR transcriptional regulator [Paenibacillaceae bacterium]